MIVKIGTRGSRLSLVQTDYVINILRKINRQLRFQKVVIKTVGDVFRQKPPYSFTSRGIFEKEINLAVIRGEVDFAVHSLKDIASEDDDELSVAAIPKRESSNDVLISKDGEMFYELKENSVIGTSSIRRMTQIKFHRPDLKVIRLRGNVERRISRVTNGEFDAVVLAEAGVRRLGLQNKISERLPLDVFTPVPGQGAIAAVARKDRNEMLNLLSRIDHKKSRNECVLERTIASRLGGGCQVPMGVIAHETKGSLLVYSALYSTDGRRKVAYSAKSESSDVLGIARRFTSKLFEIGASEVINEWRETKTSW